MSLPVSRLIDVDLADVARQAVVTDHAVVRYMEQALGFDIEGLRAELLSLTTLQGMALGAVKVHLPSAGVCLVLQGTRVVTVIARRIEDR